MAMPFFLMAYAHLVCPQKKILQKIIEKFFSTSVDILLFYVIIISVMITIIEIKIIKIKEI